MVLGVDDPGDIDFENTADLTIRGKEFENQNVTGDRKAPQRRDLFPGNEVREMFGDDLPQSATVEWQGTKYPARLSFRTRQGGGAVPVYEFFLDSETRQMLMRKHPA